jgi:hypothetical protein
MRKVYQQNKFPNNIIIKHQISLGFSIEAIESPQIYIFSKELKIGRECMEE